MTHTNLDQQKCKACEGGIDPFEKSTALNLLPQLNQDWKFSEDDKKIERNYRFKNYYQTIAFVNAVAWVSHTEDHHPDLSVSYKNCIVNYTTHAIDGLSQNDFICAAKIDKLVVE